MQGFGTTIFAEMSALAVATGSINLGQGFPDTDGPAEVLEAAVAAIRAGHNQYPPGHRHPRAPRTRSPRTRRSGTALEYDPDTEVLVTAGATEAIAAALLALCEPGTRSSPSSRTTTRTRRASRWPARSGGSCSCARPTGRSIADALERAITPDTRVPAPQLAAQPDRQGVLGRGARADRAAVRRARPHRDHRRGLRAPGLRRAARPARHPAGDARPHGHDLVGRQDVLVHGLEDRLALRAARPRRRGPDGQAVPHLRERRAVPVRRRRRARPPRLGVPAGRRRARREARPAVAPASPTPGSPCCPSAGTYFVTVDIRSARRDRRARVLPVAPRAVRRGRPSRASCSTTTRTPATRSCASRAASAST